MTLADARNDVIHRGALTKLEYGPPPERPQSAYVGSLFWVGERVLREAIKARLGPEILLCGAIRRRARATATFGPIVARLRKSARSKQAGAPSVPEPKPRSLVALLSELNCPAANLVIVRRVGSPVRATDQGGGGYAYVWAADYGGKSSMLIRNAERDLLKQAGAEDEISDWLFPCD